jgi:hypothetical protein
MRSYNKMEVVIQKSSKPGKKYQATDNKGRTTHFGATGYSDFTKNKDEQRRQNYIKRHRKNENWSDIMSAGFLARHVLWEEPTVRGAVEKLHKRYKHVSFKLK